MMICSGVDANVHDAVRRIGKSDVDDVSVVGYRKPGRMITQRRRSSPNGMELIDEEHMFPTTSYGHDVDISLEAECVPSWLSVAGYFQTSHLEARSWKSPMDL